MSAILKNSLRFSQATSVSRAFSSTPALDTKQWRLSQGLPANRNAEGYLTDGPDYTFLDGRPTPLLQKQKFRMLRQRDYASRIVEMCSELDFAKDRYQKIQQAETKERQRILDDRLKPKGFALYKKK